MLCYVTAVISCSVLVERTRSSEYPSNYSTERLKAKKKLILWTRLNSAVECGYLNREQTFVMYSSCCAMKNYHRHSAYMTILNIWEKYVIRGEGSDEKISLVFTVRGQFGRGSIYIGSGEAWWVI